MKNSSRDVSIAVLVTLAVWPLCPESHRESPADVHMHLIHEEAADFYFVGRATNTAIASTSATNSYGSALPDGLIQAPKLK